MPKVIDLPTATSMSKNDFFMVEGSSGGTKKITKANALSEIGAGVAASSNITSIPSDTITNLCSVTIAPGKWLITAQTRIRMLVANKFATFSLSTVSATEQPSDVGGFAQISNSIVGFHGVNLCRLWSPSETTTIYLTAWHNTGQNATALAGQNFIRAIRIW